MSFDPKIGIVFPAEGDGVEETGTRGTSPSRDTGRGFFCCRFGFLFRFTAIAGESTTAGEASIVDGGRDACRSEASAYDIPFPVTFAPRLINRSTKLPRFVPEIFLSEEPDLARDAEEEFFVIIVLY